MALTKIGTDGVKDDAVTSGKIPANAVGSSELADQSVTLAKLPHGDGSSDGKFLRANNGADPTFETVDTTPSFGSQNISTTGTLSSGNITISTNTDASLFINTTNANGSHLRLQTSGTTKSFIGQASGISGSLGNANDLAIRSAEDIVFSTNNNNTPNVKIDSSGNVGIGETAPADNRMRVTSPHANCIVARSTNGNGSYENFTGLASNGVKTSYITHNGRVGAADGIIFGSDTAAANILDDYEEGTWSPGIDRNASSMTGVSYSHRTGTYTKVGRLVTVWFDFQVSSGGTSGGGNYYITELPFTALYGSGGSSNNGGYGAPTFRDATLVHGDFRIYGSSSYISNRQIYLQHYNSSGNATATSCNGSGRLTGQATYFAA